MSLSEPTFAYIVASEEEDAPVAILAELPNGDQIWSGEISNALFNEQSQETQDQLGSDSGDFIVHADHGEVRVLARAVNAEAAMILTEAYARLLAARQEGSARDDGAAMRHTLSVRETDKSARAEGVAALQQVGEPISRENLEAELRETIGLYVREAVTRMFSEENATYRCARQIAGMLQPGYYLHRKLFSSPLPQQTALVEGVEKIIGPHEPAACGEGTLPSPSVPQRSDGWQDISSAPRDGTTIQARIPGHGSDNMIAWISDALDDGNGSCGAWTFVLEDQEPPSCWSDGWCWAVNEDGERSAEPTEWKAPPPPAEGGEG